MGIIFGDQPKVVEEQPKVNEEVAVSEEKSEAAETPAAEEVADPVDDVVPQPEEKPVRRGRRRK